MKSGQSYSRDVGLQKTGGASIRHSVRHLLDFQGRPDLAIWELLGEAFDRAGSGADESCRPRFLPSGRHWSVSSRFRGQGYETLARFSVTFSEISHNASDVIVERCGMSLADGPDVLDDFVNKIIARAVIRLDHR